MNNKFDQQEIYTAGSLDFTNWGLDFHQLMLGDKIRMDAYKKAIFEVVKPGMSVCEIGVGTGVLSKWALEAGASVVYGIEVDKEILKIAEENLASFGKKFIPLCGLSYDVSLPEKVDLILSEILGNIADNENFCRILTDAQKRFLKEGGQMLPMEAISYLVPVSAQKAHENIDQRKIKSSHTDSVFAKKLNGIEKSELFNYYYDSILSNDLYLSTPHTIQKFGIDCWSEIYIKDLEFKILSDGLFTGFKGWFCSRLSDSVTLDIESSENYSDSWKHAYFPIEFSISVKNGDILQVRFSRNENNKYSWSGKVLRNDGVYAEFTQCIK